MGYHLSPNYPEVHDYGKHISGRCPHCRRAFRWEKRRAGLPSRMKDARCPVDGHPLRQTTHLLRGGWYGLVPDATPERQEAS